MSTAPYPTFQEATRVWLAVGLNSFGGPAGQIAVMHRMLVEERRWVSDHRFLHALNYCMLLPGPEAQQLATYLGWLLHGYRGGLVAGILFVLPGFVAILALSLLYVSFQDLAAVKALFFGLKAAVLAIVFEALWRIGRRVLRNPALLALAGAAFAALFLFACPFPLVIAGAAMMGFLGAGVAPGLFTLEPPRGGGSTHAAVIDAAIDARRDRPAETSARRAARVLAVSLTLWLGPIAVLWWWLGPDSVYVEEAIFFSKAAVVTFGGAYAVLAYIAQQAVDTYHWLAPGEMLDGLGLAETTPGPLIQVVQFVGFMGAYRSPSSLAPLAAGVLGSVVTTWVTYAPCFLWIFLGAPYVERLRTNERLAGALSAITASVVGVILNLALWFGAHVLFATVTTVSLPPGMHLLVPVWDTLNLPAVLIAAAVFVTIVRFGTPMVPTLLASAGVGMIYQLLASG
jgi:chromate transporter